MDSTSRARHGRQHSHLWLYNQHLLQQQLALSAAAAWVERCQSIWLQQYTNAIRGEVKHSIAMVVLPLSVHSFCPVLLSAALKCMLLRPVHARLYIGAAHSCPAAELDLDVLCSV